MFIEVFDGAGNVILINPALIETIEEVDNNQTIIIMNSGRQIASLSSYEEMQHRLDEAGLFKLPEVENKEEE